MIYEYKGSRTQKSSVTTKDPARVVGIPKACIASLHKNSRIDDLRTAFPSANLLYGVLPEPLNYNSHISPSNCYYLINNYIIYHDLIDIYLILAF
jgi:hypothetical protein